MVDDPFLVFESTVIGPGGRASFIVAPRLTHRFAGLAIVESAKHILVETLAVYNHGVIRQHKLPVEFAKLRGSALDARGFVKPPLLLDGEPMFECCDVGGFEWLISKDHHLTLIVSNPTDANVRFAGHVRVNE
jgi:hypothetical protein